MYDNFINSPLIFINKYKYNHKYFQIGKIIKNQHSLIDTIS